MKEALIYTDKKIDGVDVIYKVKYEMIEINDDSNSFFLIDDNERIMAIVPFGTIIICND